MNKRDDTGIESDRPRLCLYHFLGSNIHSLQKLSINRGALQPSLPLFLSYHPLNMASSSVHSVSRVPPISLSPVDNLNCTEPRSLPSPRPPPTPPPPTP